MKKRPQIIQEVDAIYHWLDEQLAGLGQSCNACGECCDFDSFGHKLYVTTPELVYFQHFIGPDIKPMTSGVCPCRIDGKCTAYPGRFAGCRIFTCKGDPEKENRISEETIHKFKALCDEHGMAYHYVSLPVGIKMITSDMIFKTHTV